MDAYQPGQADLLCREHRSAEASALLRRCAANGDASAMFDLAVWRLRGSEIARDLADARRLLALASAKEHPDAALLLVSLLATGSGAAPDFAGALGLLRGAAARDGIAAAHLRLVATMGLHADGRPTKVPEAVVLSEHARIRRFPGLLRVAECEHLISTFGAFVRPSMVVDPISGRQVVHPVRRSHAATIGPTRETLVVAALNLRIAEATATPAANGEPLTLLRYDPGDEFRSHLDVLPGERNQRIATAIVYLNDGFAGGETTFPALGLTVRPRAGDALTFDNVLDDGSPNPLVRHAGLPVTRGRKWIATRWIRKAPLDPWSAAVR